MCPHNPPCPAAHEPDREHARVIGRDYLLGWALLCNGTIVFDDTGSLLPDGQVIAPHRPTFEGAAA